VVEGLLMGVGVAATAEPKLTWAWSSVLAAPENGGEVKDVLDFFSLLWLVCDAGSERTVPEAAGAVKK
jgi:hypothetical protein